MKCEWPTFDWKQGDKVYYTGLYWDCRTPVINLKCQGTVLEIIEFKPEGELDRIKIKVDFGGNIDIVFPCELSHEPRGF
jgi:hypothetical protein